MQYKSTYFKFSVNNQAVVSSIAYIPEYRAGRYDSFNSELSGIIKSLRQIGILSEDQTLIDVSVVQLSEIVERLNLGEKSLKVYELLDALRFGDKSAKVCFDKFRSNDINSLLIAVGLLQPNESINDLDFSMIEEIRQKVLEPPYFYGRGASDVINGLERLINYKNETEKVDKGRFTIDDEQNLNNHLAEIAADGWKLHSMQPIVKAVKEGNGIDVGTIYTSHSIQEGFVIFWEKN